MSPHGTFHIGFKARVDLSTPVLCSRFHMILSQLWIPRLRPNTRVTAQCYFWNDWRIRTHDLAAQIPTLYADWAIAAGLLLLFSKFIYLFFDLDKNMSAFFKLWRSTFLVEIFKVKIIETNFVFTRRFPLFIQERRRVLSLRLLEIWLLSGGVVNILVMYFCTDQIPKFKIRYPRKTSITTVQSLTSMQQFNQICWTKTMKWTARKYKGCRTLGSSKILLKTYLFRKYYDC